MNYRKFKIRRDTLESLMRTHPFYVIAQMYGCSFSIVYRRAREFGLMSKFKKHEITAAEKLRILELAGLGWTIADIAKDIGRSYACVCRRLKRPVRATSKSDGVMPRPDKPTVKPAVALANVCYGKPVVSSGPTVNGNVMARFMAHVP